MAMAQDTLDLARAGYDAWSRGDLEGMLTTLHEEVEFRSSGLFPGLDEVYRGHAGMRKYWDDFRSPWQSVRIVIDHFRERGDQIVAFFTFEAVGRDGLAVHREAANALTLRGGLAIRIDSYGSWKAASEAVGLSERPG
jgi:ketosteroid isomerase-like protein